MYRGEAQGVLTLTVDPEPGPARSGGHRADRLRATDRGAVPASPTGPARRTAGCWTRCAGPGGPGCWSRLSVDLRTRLRQSAEREAAAVFAANLKDLLLAAPAGGRTTLGLDPGFRTGVKVAVVDGTGKVVATDTIYPHQPATAGSSRWPRLERLVGVHRVELVAIGNGTASRETDRLAADLDRPVPRADQGRGVRGGCVGVLRVGLRVRRTARPGRLAARRGVDRPPAAGPAGRAGQDRPEVDRGRPVPARRGGVGAGPLASTRWSRTA